MNEARKEMKQIIRMLEDAVISESNPFIYMLIGKLVILQNIIDAEENTELEWSNEHE